MRTRSKRIIGYSVHPGKGARHHLIIHHKVTRIALDWASLSFVVHDVVEGIDDSLVDAGTQLNGNTLEKGQDTFFANKRSTLVDEQLEYLIGYLAGLKNAWTLETYSVLLNILTEVAP